MLGALVSAETDVAWESMGKFKLDNAAFPSIGQYSDSDPFLLCSSFTGSPIGHGHLYVVDGIKDAIVNDTVSKLKAKKLKVSSFEWPNDAAMIPDDVFGDGSRSIIVPDGFLVPGKSNGGVYIVTIDPTDVTKALEKITLTSNKDGYFYHMGYWLDMNNDGRKDFVTAKANAKAGGGRLVWLEHPAEGITGDWTEHVIVDGPDVGIWVDTDTYKNSIVVYAAQFFDQSVNMY